MYMYEPGPSVYDYMIIWIWLYEYDYMNMIIWDTKKPAMIAGYGYDYEDMIW